MQEWDVSDGKTGQRGVVKQGKKLCVSYQPETGTMSNIDGSYKGVFNADQRQVENY